MTGQCGWVRPPDLACTMPCRTDRMTDQRDEAETSTDPSHQVEPFFFLILILMNKVDHRAEPVRPPGPWRACCRGATRPETLAVLLPARVRRRVPLVWALGCGKRRACASGRGARRCRWREKYTLFIFRFCQRQTGEWNGAESLLCGGCPGTEGPDAASQALYPEPRGQTASPGV